jgi:redox-sensitive bicupin YhaK (pirin superfamily)
VIQTWVALPEKDEELAPSFTNYKPDQLPVYTDTGVWMRLIARNAIGLENVLKINSPMCCPHVTMLEGARLKRSLFPN